MVTAKSRCRLTVRFEWDVTPGYAHPSVTWGCAESRKQAARFAENILIVPTDGIRLIGVSTQADRRAHWIPVYYAALDGGGEISNGTPHQHQSPETVAAGSL